MCIIKVLRRASKELTRITRINGWTWINKKKNFTHVGLSAHAHNNYFARGQSSRMAAFLELKLTVLC